MPARERGSVLALVPAAVLVVVLLGALAVDSAAAFLAQRQLSDAIAGAANDAATAALSDAAFYQSGQLAIDQRTAVSVVCASMAATLDAHIHVTSLQIAVEGRWVHLRAAATVRRIILTGAPLVSALMSVRSAAAAVGLRSSRDTAPDGTGGTALAWQTVSC